MKFSQSPLKMSLLPLEGELNVSAIETFITIMRYTGDFPMDPQQTEAHCVYFILKVSVLFSLYYLVSYTHTFVVIIMKATLKGTISLGSQEKRKDRKSRKVGVKRK